MASPRPRLTWQKKLLFAAVLISLLIGFAEGVGRLLGYPQGVVRSFSRLWNPDPGSTPGLFRPGSHRIGYPRELAYGVTVNSLGLRGGDVSAAKTEGTLRLLALGDSVTFGYYIEDEATYPALLQARLRADGRQVEVLNAGCGHFSLPDEHAYLRERLLQLQPDCVILQFCSNDLGSRELDRDPTLYAEIAAGQVGKPSSWLRSTALGELQLLAAIRLKQWRREREGEWPPKGFSPAGESPSEEAWQRYADELKQVKATLDEAKVPLVMTSFAGLRDVEQAEPPETEQRLERIAKGLGIPFRGTWKAYREAEDPKSLYHWPLDPHPSRQGNEALARTVAELVRETGLLR